MRLRFRYSLKFFLLCWLLIGLGLGWFGVYLQKGRRQAAAIATLQQVWHCTVTYDYDYEEPELKPDSIWTLSSRAPNRSPYSNWLINRLGIDFFHHVAKISLSPPLNGDNPFVEPEPPTVPFNQWKVLESFSELKEIQFLNYRRCRSPLDESFFVALHDQPELVKLEIQYTHLKKEQLAQVQNHPALKFLEIYQCKYGPDALSGLGTLPKLEKLHCSTFQTPAHSNRFAFPECPQLRILNLAKAPCDIRALRSLSNFKKLETLYLDDFDATPEAITALQQIPQLTRLSLRDIPSLEDDELARLVRALPNLEAIDLGETNADAETLRALTEHTKLKSVNLGSSKADGNGLVDDFRKARRDLQVHGKPYGILLDWIELFNPQDELLEMQSLTLECGLETITKHHAPEP